MAATARPLIAPSSRETLEAILEMTDCLPHQVRPSDLDAILLLGGSTRTAAVATLATRHFGRTPLRMARPEEAIALGAAALAQRMQAQQFASS